MTPILETKRLILRPVTIEDAPAAQKYFNNWNIIKNMGSRVPWPYPDNGAEDFYKNNALPRVALGETHLWALTLRGSDELVGTIEFRLVPNEEDNRGFWLAEHLWGKGLMSEAAAVNDYVFGVLGFDHFTSTNNTLNAASRTIKKKSGAELVEVIDKINAAGEPVKSEVWRMTRDAWNRTRNSN